MKRAGMIHALHAAAVAALLAMPDEARRVVNRQEPEPMPEPMPPIKVMPEQAFAPKQSRRRKRRKGGAA